MDALSVGGFILAFFAIIVGSILKGAGVGSLLNRRRLHHRRSWAPSPRS